jgi:hypothetical protein
MLTTHGVPYETAVSWSQAMRIAALVAIGEAKGGVYHWDAGRWEWPQ